MACGRPDAVVGQGRLPRDGALHRIDRAGEIGNDAVTGGIEDPTSVVGDQLVNDRATGFQPAQRTGLVLPDKPAAPRHVGGEDCREFAL